MKYRFSYIMHVNEGLGTISIGHLMLLIRYLVTSISKIVR